MDEGVGRVVVGDADVARERLAAGEVAASVSDDLIQGQEGRAEVLGTGQGILFQQSATSGVKSGTTS